MLIDKVQIYVKAGDGGNGKVSFRREKFVSHGGPDGGDGGRGGNIIFKIQEGENTLIYYKNQRKFLAENGFGGEGSKFHGADGKDTILPVPPGTVIRDADSGKVIYDMSSGDNYILCKGGRGGWGNKHFATPSRQTPRFAKSGLRGEEKNIILELKMLADVGIIGLPNVGKSSLLSVISSAKPKIANYEFTTLSPSLGVVKLGEAKWIAADNPGLIEGASSGLGLGYEFLRHIERCRLFLHVVDITADSPIKNIEIINNELKTYNIELLNRPQIIIANKCDIEGFDENKILLGNYANENKYDILNISTITGEGIEALIKKVTYQLSKLPPLLVFEPEIIPEEESIYDNNHDVVIRRENNTFYVEGEWLYNLMGSINIEDRDSLRYFQRTLNNFGVIDELRKAGCTDGNEVDIYDFVFDFVN